MGTALIGYLVISPRRPKAKGVISPIERMSSIAGVWLSLILASGALQCALLAASWRIYRELRLAGLYPPGNQSIAKGLTVKHVSVLEVVCEGEDLATLKGYSCCGALLDKDEIEVASIQVDHAPANYIPRAGNTHENTKASSRLSGPRYGYSS